MRRATLTSLMTILGLALLLPAAASARGVVSTQYELLDGKIDRAWDQGYLTAWELDELRALQAHADRVIDRAFRDGFVTGREQTKIDVETDEVVATFRIYRDNASMRWIRPPAVVVTKPYPRPPATVVVVKTSPPKVVHHHHGHGHKSGHHKGGKSHRR